MTPTLRTCLEVILFSVAGIGAIGFNRVRPLAIKEIGSFLEILLKLPRQRSSFSQLLTLLKLLQENVLDVGWFDL